MYQGVSRYHDDPDFWLSPLGEKIICTVNHEETAKMILRKQGHNGPYVPCAMSLLLRQGWMYYRNGQLGERGFVKPHYVLTYYRHMYGEDYPTQAQRDAIFDLTGRNYSDDMLAYR
jgi:hypothetical protein